MTEPAASPPPKKKGCLRRLLTALVLGFILLLVLLIGAYGARTPLIRYAAKKIGATQQLDIAVNVTGSFFGSIVVDGLTIHPTGPNELENIAVGHVLARYSVWKLIRGDFENAIERVEVSDVNVAIKPDPALEKKPKQPKKAGSQIVDWDAIFKQPALFVHHVEIQRVNVVVHQPEGDLLVKNAGGRIEPGTPGAITVEQLTIPKAIDWRNISGGLRNDRGKLELTALKLDADTVLDGVEVSPATETLTTSGRYKGATFRVNLQVKKGIGYAQFQAGVDRLSTLAPAIKTGRITASGTAEIREKDVTLAVSGAANGFENAQAKLKVATFQLNATKVVLPPSKVPTVGLTAKLTAQFKDASASGYMLDGGEVDVAVKENVVTIAHVGLQRSKNTVEVHGSAQIPEQPENLKKAPFDLEFHVDAPELSAFSDEQNLKSLNGTMRVDGKFHSRAGKFDGEALAVADGLNFQGFTARELRAKVVLDDHFVRLNELYLAINDHDFVNGWAQADVNQPNAYLGRLQAYVSNLGIFDPFLHASQPSAKLAGSVQLEWQGEGTVQPHAHHGWLKFNADNVQNGPGPKLDHAQIAGSYSPEKTELSDIALASGPSHFSGQLEMAEGKLKLHDIALEQSGLRVLSGFLVVPFDLTQKEPAKMVPQDGRVAANLNAQKLDLAKLATMAGQKASPIGGLLSMNLLASGSVAQPVATLNLHLEKIIAAAAPKAGATDVNLNLHLAKTEQTLDGVIRQAQLQPLTIKGKTNVDVEKILASKQLDPATPIALDVKMPSSSLSFLTAFAPMVRFIQGTAGIDLHATGTVGAPDIRGNVALDLPAVRFADQSLPSINAFKARINYAGKKVVFEQFSGALAGGTFSLGGNVDLKDPKKPVFALKAGANNALLLRNDSVTFRTDADIAITGPLDGALVKGAVNITKSRFFREIEILPIELPGKPAPKAQYSTPGISIPNPPIANWKFDIAIKTLDPFKINGNLANGKADVDLHLGGTGLQPEIEGYATVSDFIASLPFSKLTISYGYIYFTKDEPLVPHLDIQGTSQIRNYTISVYIYGEPSAPTTIFTSEPPLPQEEIISLLATGLTSSELTSDSSALAGRAAILAVQSLYHKVFKKAPPADDKQSFADRFTIDLGSVDSRTGRQAASAKFELSRRIFLIGSFDVEGSVSGRVQYLLRFK